MPTKIEIAAWRTMAEQARVIAAEIHEPGGQRIMLKVAADYEALVARAEAEGGGTC
jgi:hypothetical protein